ncbi:MAG: hypothetical protein ACFB2Z_01420 [Maricaulaceae bacterium]
MCSTPGALRVYGRIALEGALSWLIFAAISLLFFVSGQDPLPGALAVAIAIGFGGYVFFRAVAPVRSKMVAAKATELDHVCERLRAAKVAMLSGDATASAVVPGLIAYETRIEQTPDWPISAPLAVRAGFLIFIPVLPWFGSALVEQAVERLSGG